MSRRFTLIIGILILIGYSDQVVAQQLPQRTAFSGTNFIWNPAMTAFEEHWEAGLTHRQEWVGFEDAPQTSTIYGQYPFVKQNASLGGFFMLDQVKPIQNNVLAMTYAYKIGGSKGKKREAGQLSIGLMVSMSHLFIDGLDIVATHANDPLQPVGELSKFQPNVGAGVFYISKPTGKGGLSFFYGGLAANQILPTDFTFRETSPAGNLSSAIHGNASIGYRAVNDNLIIEPSIWLNFAGENIIDGQLGFLVEKPQSFWAGLHYNVNQTLSFQLGYSLADSFTESGRVRIGAKGTYNVGDFGKVRGLGYEFYLAYRIKA